jgi:hypothetical protein
MIHRAGPADRGFVGIEHTAGVARKGATRANSRRNRAIRVDSVLYGIGGSNAAATADITPTRERVRVVRYGSAGSVAIRVRLIRLENRASNALLGCQCRLVVVVGPPSPVATPATLVTRNQELLRQVDSSACPSLDKAFQNSNGRKCPATTARLLVLHARQGGAQVI